MNTVFGFKLHLIINEFILPVSGRMVTHFTIRKERGLPDGIPVVDEYAP